jgi:hypothetical protein
MTSPDKVGYFNYGPGKLKFSQGNWKNPDVLKIKERYVVFLKTTSFYHKQISLFFNKLESGSRTSGKKLR